MMCVPFIQRACVCCAHHWRNKLAQGLQPGGGEYEMPNVFASNASSEGREGNEDEKNVKRITCWCKKRKTEKRKG